MHDGNSRIAPLPRSRSLTTPPKGLAGAIGAWLASWGKLVAAGFITKKPRRMDLSLKRPITPLAAKANEQASLRDRTEMVQLRAENRRLRARIESLESPQDKPVIPCWSDRKKADAD